MAHCDSEKSAAKEAAAKKAAEEKAARELGLFLSHVCMFIFMESCNGVVVRVLSCNQQVTGSNPSHYRTTWCNPGQIDITHVPLSQNSVIGTSQCGW